MFIAFSIMIIGVVAGYFLRSVPNITFLGKLISAFIFMLLFLLGVSVGKNDIIINNLTSIGLQALVITLGAIIGSIFLGNIVYKKFFRKKGDGI